MQKAVKNYVHSCDICTKAKTSCHQPYGMLQLLPVLSGPWQSILMDFITDLPPCKGYDSILVVFDYFTKMSYFIPYNKDIMAKRTAELILQQVICLYGLPREIISD